MKKNPAFFFKPLPSLSPGKSLLLRILMVPNFFLIRAQGMENLCREEGAKIYAFNHNNSLEALLVPVFIIYSLGESAISFVIDWMYGKIPIIGNLMEMTEPVYVYHKRSRIPWIKKERHRLPPDNVIEQCAGKLRSGRSIGIFPEGKRNRNPEHLMKGRPGIGHIALLSGVPVIPVGIDFNSRTARNRIPVIGRMILRAGRPLHFRKESEEYRNILALDVSNRKEWPELNRLAEDVTHEIMLSLSGLSGKKYNQPCPELTDNRRKRTRKLEEQPCPV